MNCGLRAGILALVVAAAAVLGAGNAGPASAIAAAPAAASSGPQKEWTPAADRRIALGDADRPGLAGAAQDATLTIKTAPPLPRVRLTLDDTTVVTDESGVATISQQRSSQMHTLTLLDTGIETADRRYTFTRWVGQRDPEQAFAPTLDGLSMRADSALTVAFSVQQPITPHFVDQNGQIIDSSLIASATVRSDAGELITVDPNGPTWLEGVRASYHGNTLDLQKASYSWQTVLVSGTNVVDAGRESFTPATTPDVTAVGQFHDLTVTGYDALLGHGAGDQAVVVLPDGTVRTAQLDGGHEAIFPHLPRGTYQAKISAGSSIVGDHQVRLSRDVTLSVPVISPVDLAILAAALILLALGLILIGRRNIRHRLTAPFRAAVVAKGEGR